jgi:ribose 5-phosphate isomerase A
MDFAPRVVADAVRSLGATEILTRPLRSDNGNLVMVAHFGTITDPLGLAAELAAVPGLVEHGIFPGDMVDRVVVADAEGVRELVNPRH